MYNVVNFGEFVQVEIYVCGDVDQNVFGILQVDVFQQWVVNGGFGCFLSMVFVGGVGGVYYCYIYF